VLVPLSGGRTAAEVILLCGHHYVISEQALISVEAAVYDASGWPVSLPSSERTLTAAAAGPASVRKAGRAATAAR
jgi:hypothetical protein